MNFKRLLGAAGGLLFLANTSAQSQTVFIATEGAFGTPAGNIFWESLGPTGTNVAHPFTIGATGIAGLSATVRQTAGIPFQRRDQGSGWSGNFAPGAKLLWTQGGGPASFAFNSPISAFGTQIQTNVFGLFTGTISAFDPSNVLLGTFAFTGNSTTAGDNSARFVGISSSTGIGRIELNTRIGTSNGDFAINQVRLNGQGVNVVPEPATMLLVGSGLGALGAFRRRRTLG